MSDRAPMITVSDAETAALLLSALNSFAVDFAARTSVGGTDLSFFLIRQLPIVAPSDFLDELTHGTTYADFAIPRVLELTYTSWEVRSFAEGLGYCGPPFQWDEERRFIIKCELDAALFHLYGLDMDDVDYIMDTFPIVKRNDERAHGEYRTKRAILEIYDDMRRARQNGTPFASRLRDLPDLSGPRE